MTNWDKLIVMMDRVFGFGQKQSSSVRKIKQDFDEKSNEHVIWLEYRIKPSRGGVVTKPKHSGGDDTKPSKELLQQINTLVKQKK
jgi:hypothetical protein